MLKSITYDELQQRVQDFINPNEDKEVRVYFSAYEYDPFYVALERQIWNEGPHTDYTTDILIDNLDEVPIEGLVHFSDPYAWVQEDSGGKEYMSPVVESPTWLEICKLANDMILTTRDFHHVYLESVGVASINRKTGVKDCRFNMGS